MRKVIYMLVLSMAAYAAVYAMPVVDESSITDEDQFLIDNGRCLALSQSGGGGGNFEKNVLTGAGLGAASGVAFGAMTGGDVGSGAALGAVVGGLGSAGSIYKGATPVNNNSYTSCMEQKGYRFK